MEKLNVCCSQFFIIGCKGQLQNRKITGEHKTLKYKTAERDQFTTWFDQMMTKLVFTGIKHMVQDIKGTT